MNVVTQIESQNEWDGFVEEYNGHPLQLWGWGEVKSAHGWKALRLKVENGETQRGGAQILVKRLPAPLGALVYIPRGPFGTDTDEILEALVQYAKKHIRAVCLRIEPHSETMTLPERWQKTDSTILIPQTLILDLNKTEEELLADISSKRRYDIRKSTKDVTRLEVEKGSEALEEVLRVYQATAKRAGFPLHELQYYRDIATMLGDHSVIIGARDEKNELVAFTWFAVSTEVAFELYSGITPEGQKLRANYALKWYAITRMKEWGVKQYDFNGLLNDGISDFKRSFASHDNLLIGTYEYPLSPWYVLWSKGLPLVRSVLRTIKNLR